MTRRLLQSAYTVSILTFAVASSCASSVRKYDHPPSTTPSEETQRIEEEMDALNKKSERGSIETSHLNAS